MEKALMKYEEQKPLSAQDIRTQVNLIQEVMKSVMKEDEHYGKIPGCGDKPTLLQPGAQKLIMTFRLVPDPELTVIDLVGDHREYRVKVKLCTQQGTFLGAGLGSCSTLEGKFRYRTGPVEFTDKPVPAEYWNTRKEDPVKAQKLLGGPGFVAKKNENSQWVIAKQGEKVEHDNPADYYNTCEKMAYKRGLVSATLIVTAASDIFTQDIEDMPEVIEKKTSSKETTGDIPTPQPKKQQPEKGHDGTLTVTATIQEVSSKTGNTKGKKWTLYGIKADGQWYNTFDKELADSAKEAEGRVVEIQYTQGAKSKDLKVITLVDDSTETVDGDCEGCTHDPNGCEHSIWVDDKTICNGLNGKECPCVTEKTLL